jgi:hypothetical protein
MRRHALPRPRRISAIVAPSNSADPQSPGRHAHDGHRMSALAQQRDGSARQNLDIVRMGVDRQNT